jgi:hypothetical protein
MGLDKGHGLENIGQYTVYIKFTIVIPRLIAVVSSQGHRQGTLYG